MTTSRPSRHVKNGVTTPTSSTKTNRWVFIVNDEIVTSNDNKDAGKMACLCKFRHPRIDSAALYLVSGDESSIYELNCFDEKFHSWFIGDTVHSGGQVYITTPVDPLFLIIPYLINAGKSNRYMSLDQLVNDDDFPDCHKLLACADADQLAMIADVKDVDEDIRVHRYNSEKTLAWLKAKIEMTGDALKSKNISVSTKGSHSAIYVHSKKAQESRDSYLRYACGLISDYLPGTLEDELRQYLGFTDVPENVPRDAIENEPPTKKSKMDADVGPVEDYSVGELKKERSKTGKLTTAQKQLQKVDKTGMKSISSFFTRK